jgi:molybdopterin converting factor small subunit
MSRGHLPPIAATLNKVLKRDAPGGFPVRAILLCVALGSNEHLARAIMPVTLHLPTVLAKLADGRVLDAEGVTVGAVVADVATRYPALAPRLRDDTGKPYPFVTFYLNDEDIRFHGGFEAAVQDGDELTVVPAIAGG